MAGLDPANHVFVVATALATQVGFERSVAFSRKTPNGVTFTLNLHKSWMAGSSPAMTE